MPNIRVDLLLSLMKIKRERRIINEILASSKIFRILTALVPNNYDIGKSFYIIGYDCFIHHRPNMGEMLEVRIIKQAGKHRIWIPSHTLSMISFIKNHMWMNSFPHTCFRIESALPVAR